MDKKPKQSPSYIQALGMLPEHLHSVLDALMAEYQFAALKHHGRALVSPVVVAELVLGGWRCQEPAIQPSSSSNDAVSQ